MVKRGILLCGGNGTRLRPLTNYTNKHLLPIFNKQMIMYPLQTMLDSGIDDILIISGEEHSGHFSSLLGSGLRFNAEFTYKIQDQAGGIAQALGLAENFIGQDTKPFLVLLGDNIFEDKLDLSLTGQAKVFLKKVPDAFRFGVAEFNHDQSIKYIVEKPKQTHSGWAVTGAYIYHNDIFELIKRMKPSDRGELEITDLNNHYANLGVLYHDKLNGYWSDAGTFESLNRASNWAKSKIVL